MLLKKNKYIYFVAIITILLTSCIEPFEIKNISYESNLVVRAVITNEFKIQTINLSNTTEIDSTGIRPEKNAFISIIDNTNIVYDFKETNKGTYESINEFKAEPAKTYILNIETEDGVKYTSTPEKLPVTAEIEKIFFNIEENNTGEIQAVIKTNSISSNNEGQYYRYEYDETFKVKTPTWANHKLLVISDTTPYKFDLILKTPEDGIGFCYGTRKSKNIILTETLTFSEDRNFNFPIKYMSLDDYIIGIRYSILLKQYVINKNTYDYYQLLNKFSSPDNIFSQVQVGNIPSNISSESERKVIGFFETSTISTKRVFFNRSDITSETTYINYQEQGQCNIIQPEIENYKGESPLLNSLFSYIFQGIPSPDDWTINKPYKLIPKKCGDCTSIGPPTTPNFWID